LLPAAAVEDGRYRAGALASCCRARILARQFHQAPASSAGTRDCQRRGHQRSRWPHRCAWAPPV